MKDIGFKTRAFAVAIMAAAFCLSCGDSPTTPTQTGPQPSVVTVNVCASGSCNTQPAPSTNVPGTNACPAVVSAGVNVPGRIAISDAPEAHRLDTTPRGPGGVAFDPTCTPLPSVTWVTTAECKVSDPAKFIPYLTGVSVGVCQIYAVVGGFKTQTEPVTVVP
jgi:hypothetical protein